MSGWSNDSGMVIVYNMIEREIGNRVSKSGYLNNYLNVCKRATSRRQLPFNIKGLRYTLMAFERKYHTNILSTFSNQEINSWFITGLIDAEGSFMLKISEKRQQLEFSITLHSIDKELIMGIYKYFNIGNYRIIEKNGIYKCVFSIVSLELIINHVIPHFDKYPLQTKKRADYLLFKEAAFIKYYDKKNYNIEKLINIRASMNRGLTKSLRIKYPNIISVNRPEVEFNKDLNPYWISGFVTGDGHFSCKIVNNNRIKFLFNITQNSRDKELMEYFINYLNCGFTYINTKDNCIYYEVVKYDDIINKIIPFFNKYSVRGTKLVNYNYFKEIIQIVKFNTPLTSSELNKIQHIRNNMNEKGLANWVTKYDKVS